MNGLDWLIVTLMAVGGWWGAKLGLWRSLLRLTAGLGAWSTAITLGGPWAASLAGKTGLTTNQSESLVLAACLVVAFAIVTATDGIIVRRVRAHTTGNHVDTWAGIVLGLMQAAVLLVIGLSAGVQLPWGMFHEALDDSVLAETLLRWGPIMYETLGQAGLQ